MKQVVVVFLLFIYSTCFSQISFNTRSETYVPLLNPISLNQGQVWNNGTNYPVYFNFNFTFENQTYTALSVIAGGGLNFPGLGTKELFVFHSPFGGYLLADRGTVTSKSEIGYTISGNPGEQILKIEWKGAGFVQWYSTSDSTDFIDLQIWLFEVDNHIEVHFGSSQADPGTYGFPVATSDSNPGSSFKFLFDSCSNMFGLTGPANLPSYSFFNSCVPNYVFIDGTPPSGLVYAIYTSPIGIDEISNGTIKSYPNPAKEFIKIDGIPWEGKEIHVSIRTATGQIVVLKHFSSPQEESLLVPLTNLSSGMYILEVLDDRGNRHIEKIIKE